MNEQIEVMLFFAFAEKGHVPGLGHRRWLQDALTQALRCASLKFAYSIALERE